MYKIKNNSFLIKTLIKMYVDHIHRLQIVITFHICNRI